MGGQCPGRGRRGLRAGDLREGGGRSEQERGLVLVDDLRQVVSIVSARSVRFGGAWDEPP